MGYVTFEIIGDVVLFGKTREECTNIFIEEVEAALNGSLQMEEPEYEKGNIDLDELEYGADLIDLGDINE